MGLSVDVICCTGCGFEAAIAPSRMRISYLLPSGALFAAKRALGWCSKCEGFTDGESVPTPEGIRGQIESFIRSEHDRLKGEQSWVDRILQRRIPEVEPPADLGEALVVFSKRTSKARCLSCNSPGYEGLQGGGGKQIDYPLHACGGRFEWKDPDPSGPLVTMRGQVLVLSVEGEVLHRKLV